MVYVIGSRSNGQKRKEGRAHREASMARLRRLWRSTTRWFWWFSILARVTTVFRRKQRRCWCAVHDISLPIIARRCGWS
jgi:hypothetical protein